jgi:hypothetical protein
MGFDLKKSSPTTLLINNPQIYFPPKLTSFVARNKGSLRPLILLFLIEQTILWTKMLTWSNQKRVRSTFRGFVREGEKKLPSYFLG